MKTTVRLSLALGVGLASLVSCSGKDGDSSAGAGDSGASSTDYPPTTCLTLDRFDGFTVPPAGVGLGFRVLDCEGNALLDSDGSHRKLTSDEISVINGENGQDFNQSTEGGAVSEPGSADNVRVYAMLVLDMSRSIFESGNEQAVVSGALEFIDATLVNNSSNVSYEIGIIAFGGPGETEVVADFTDSATDLQTALSAAVAAGSRGTTDLYGAYMMGLSELSGAGTSAERNGEVVERIAVLWSDGAHEAGDTDNLRSQALSAKGSFAGTPFAIYVEGEDGVEDALCELANGSSSCFGVEDVGDLGSVFDTISVRARALAESNYVVGVCTPVALGNPTLELVVDIGTASTSQEAAYDTNDLTGDVDNCDPAEMQALYAEYLAGNQ